MVDRSRVLAGLEAVRTLLVVGRVDDAITYLDGMSARLADADTGLVLKPIARAPLRLISGGQGVQRSEP